MPDEVFYKHDLHKLPDAGLQLNLPPDLVPSGQYSRFSNAISRIEGQVQTRDGLELVCVLGASGLPVHSIFRLNQVVPTVVGERLFGISTELYSAPLPAGNVPNPLTEYVVANASFPAFPVSFDGTPLSIMPFRFDAGAQNSAWAIIANGQKMMKRTQGYYEQLGLPAPIAQAVATADGGGFLVGDYDWRYTYFNDASGSESNPSPEMTTSGTETLQATAHQTPDPAIGGTTANSSTNHSVELGVGSPPNDLTSIIWTNWNLPAMGSYSALTLQMSYSVGLNGPLPGGATYTVGIDYSLDGGATWQNLLTLGPSNGPLSQTGELNISLPPSQDMSLFQVRAYGSVSAVVAPAFGGSFFVGDAGPGTTPLQTVGNLTAAVPLSLTLTNEKARVCVTPPTDPQETSIRLYRRGGTLTDNWYFVNQYVLTSLVQGGCGAGTLEIIDDSSDASIEAAATLDLDNDMPVSSVNVQNQTLKAIWGFDERVLGCGDPGRPEAVYFSKRGNADEWPPENWVVVSEPGTEMMNGLSWNLRCWAWSRERLYNLVLNILLGTTFTPQETACRRGLKGRFAFCVGEKGMYFISKDGPYRTQGGLEENIADASVRPLFPTFDNPNGRDVNGYEAIDMADEDGLRLSRHNSEIWFDYTGKTSGTRQTLIYDERKDRWRGYYSAGALSTSKAQMHYSEPETISTLLTGKVSGSVLQSTGGVADESDVIAVKVRTGAYDQGAPLNLKEYGDVIFDLDPGGATLAKPVTITPYLDADQLPQAAIQVTGSGRQRAALALADYYGLNVSFEITWDTTDGHIPILYQLDILHRVEPAAMRHWEVPPSSLGLEGWFHCRDSYVTLRSAADVTMTLTADDGTTQTFTLPSTAGAKKKLYVPFAANKLKLVGFSFDSAADFRIYQPECELRAKQWVTALGYSVSPLFGAEA